MGIAFTACMVLLTVSLIYTAAAYDNSLNVPSAPMTQLEAKTLDIKGRISDQKNRLLIEANSNDTRIYAGGIS